MNGNGSGTNGNGSGTGRNGNGTNNGSGSGSGTNRIATTRRDTGTGEKEATLSLNDVKALIEDYCDEDFEHLPDKEQAMVTAAVAMAADNADNDSLSQNAASLLEDLLDRANSQIYRQYTGDYSVEYVSLGSVDKNRKLTRFRSVKERSVRQTTMSMIGRGSASYTFTVGDNTVLKNTGDTEKLEKNAVEQADQYIRNTSQTKYTYISEDDARKYLGVSCVYVGGTDWAILVPAGNEAEISELAKLIEEALENGGK